MYVCLCQAVTDKDIAEAVHNGADNLSDIAQSLGAGTGCGTCQDFAQSVIEATLAEKVSYAA